jgi:hypothetical protein
LKEVRRPKETGKILQAQKAIYALDMGSFWGYENCRIIADSESLKVGLSSGG